jgi:hypothetical protein
MSASDHEETECKASRQGRQGRKEGENDFGELIFSWNILGVRIHGNGAFTGGVARASISSSEMFRRLNT